MFNNGREELVLSRLAGFEFAKTLDNPVEDRQNLPNGSKTFLLTRQEAAPHELELVSMLLKK
jgi:hypothetical protein